MEYKGVVSLICPLLLEEQSFKITLSGLGPQPQERKERLWTPTELRSWLGQDVPPLMSTQVPPKQRSGNAVPSQVPLRTHVYLELQGQTQTALADTGAQENVMSAGMAKKLGLQVHRDDPSPHQFENARGDPMCTTGYTTVGCQFKDQPENRFPLKFWIMPKLVVPLVVGRRFLEETSCLTTFRHRLKKLKAIGKFTARILHLELPRKRLQCRIDGQMVAANPDTGSDLNLMSGWYARRSNFKMRELEPDHQYVEFADGTTAQLSGVVRVPFYIGSYEETAQLRDFYVLEGLTSDVLLGSDTLEELDAFNSYGDTFFELNEFDARCDFHYIRWVVKSENETLWNTPFSKIEFEALESGK
ncbi:hypothetical protein PV08_01942 [Exophiala spinifera]|uniref:Peptidase A2 domain-containing protein n=1 Tax=Exophiala spinifera TaxID=91928 RepID=A0A0D2A9A5_9EURO|nr:uncharacterized protein PV08_01942 [Exophiala spinifera]KIW21362.1 hypothetical protein PV08_01942 [Exophiala spinifera]